MKALPVPRLGALNMTRLQSTLFTVLLVSFVILLSHLRKKELTYKDYFQIHHEFQVPTDSQLFIAQRLWEMPSRPA
jgi:hypothetical protein